jgi:hypothetical protein
MLKMSAQHAFLTSATQVLEIACRVVQSGSKSSSLLQRIQLYVTLEHNVRTTIH